MKSSLHLNQPLVCQRLRHQNQHRLCSLSMQLLIQNKPCFNRLAEPHFVGQQHAWRKPTAYTGSHVKLMGEQSGARSKQSSEAKALTGGRMLQGRMTKPEVARLAKLVVQQSLYWRAELNMGVELSFRHGVDFAFRIFCLIGGNATAFLRGDHRQDVTVQCGQLIAWFEL